MLKSLRTEMILFPTTVALCCVAYPALLWAFGQGLFPTSANGSLVKSADGTPFGSRLIAQSFTKDEYFWPRPSAVGYNAAATGGSNWGSSQPKLRFRVARQLGPIVRYEDGRPVGPDVEAWFAKADRLAAWAAANPVAASEWVKTGDDTKQIVADWCRMNPDVMERWKADNPNAGNAPDPTAAPDALAVPFFLSFATKHPRAFPALVNGRPTPVSTGTDIQGVFFDAWLLDHPSVKLRPIPADAVMASGAGIDPHISARNAHTQIDRVANARSRGGNVTEARERIQALIRQLESSPLFGLVGDPNVNVLVLNRSLDTEFSGR